MVEELFDVEDDPAYLAPEASDWDTQYWSDQDWSDLWDAWDAEPEPAAYWQGSDWYQYGSEWDTSESMWQQPSHMWDAVHEEVPSGALTPAGSTAGTEDYADLASLETALIAQGRGFLQSRTMPRDRDTRRGFFPPEVMPGGKGQKGKKGKKGKGKKGKGKRPLICFTCGGPHRSSECSQQGLPALTGPPPMSMLKAIRVGGRKMFSQSQCEKEHST